MSELKIILSYIASWSWFIISIIFFVGLIIMLTLDNYIAAISFILCWIISFGFALKRQKEVYNEARKRG